jgi:hypothetical protein
MIKTTVLFDNNLDYFTYLMGFERKTHLKHK